MAETALTHTSPGSGTPPHPRVRLLGTRPAFAASAPSADTTTFEPALLPPTTAARSSTRLNPDFLAQMLAVMGAIGLLLATRLLLLLAVLGAFALAFLAHSTRDAMSLWLNVAYDVLVVIPLVALYWKRG